MTDLAGLNGGSMIINRTRARRVIVAIAIATAVFSAAPIAASEHGTGNFSFELSFGSQSTYAQFAVGAVYARAGRPAIGVRSILFVGFVDRVLFDPDLGLNVRYGDITPALGLFVRTAPHEVVSGIRVHGGGELIVGSVIVRTPHETFGGDNVIAGVRAIAGVSLQWTDNLDLFLEGGSGPILHFLFEQPEMPPYNAAIDGFSGFGMALGLRLR